MSPEDIHEFYLNATKMVQKGKQDSRPAEGDGWIVTLKLTSTTAEKSQVFYAGNFSNIAKKNPEFDRLEKIIAKQTFKNSSAK
jgi:hypothetical protein